MRIGMTLAGERLTADNARFAAQLGVTDIVINPGRYQQVLDRTPYLDGRAVGPILGDCSAETLWDFDYLSSIASMVSEYGLRIAALENFAPGFWSDILMDGPRRHEQMEALKGLVRDVGRAGIPVIGYNFSLAGVWGWRRLPKARGGAITSVFDTDSFDDQEPIPDGMVWNMQYRPAIPGKAFIAPDEDELWERLEWFLGELLPVAEEAGVRLAAHPDDPPVERLRGTPRLVNAPPKYDRLLALFDSRANALEYCIGSLQEMPGTDIYDLTRRHVRNGNVAYIHFRNVRGKVPQYEETFIDDGDVDMGEIVNILRDEGFSGVMVPDHVPDVHSAAPWHAGTAYTIGYMRALVASAEKHARAPKPQAF